MHLYLADWLLDPAEDALVSPYSGTLSALDMSYGANSIGIFATHDLQASGTLLGEAPDAIINKADFETAFQLGESLVATTVSEAIWEILAQQSDPTGGARPRPIMPTRKGVMNLWIGGVQWKTKRLTTSEPEWPAVLANLHQNYDQMKVAVGAGHLPVNQHRKVLSVWQQKYGVEDHTVFIPSPYPDEIPLPPATAVSDDFNRSNENLEDSANWLLLKGATGAASLVVNSNRCREDTTTANNSYGQHQTALSSDDQYAEITIEALTAPSAARTYGSAAVRVVDNGNGEINAYDYQATIDSGATKNGRLQKWTGSGPSPVSLVDEAETINLTDTMRCEADGSDITGKINGSTTAGPTTDTSLSGQLNVGLGSRLKDGVVGDCEMDNFEGADLAAAGFIPYPRYSMTGGMQPMSGGA